jgi:hypothetical protein
LPQVAHEDPAHQPDKQLRLLVVELGNAGNVCAHGSKSICADQVFHVTPAVRGRHVLSFVADAVFDGFESAQILPHYRACEHTCAQWPRGKLGQSRQQGWQGQTDPRFDVVAAQSPMKRDATHDVRAEKLVSVFGDIARSFANRVDAGERL